MEKENMYAELRGDMYKKFRKQSDFAKAIGMDPATLSGKMNGRTQWTIEEVKCVCEVLGKPLDKAHEYFFYNESCGTATE